jgi:hypothetical protein
VADPLESQTLNFYLARTMKIDEKFTKNRLIDETIERLLLKWKKTKKSVEKQRFESSFLVIMCIRFFFEHLKSHRKRRGEIFKN